MAGIEKNNGNDKDGFVRIDISDAVQGDNSYGLILNDPDHILFRSENIVIEVVGGVRDMLLSSLRVSLKIYKQGARSPLQIYRSSGVDLFDENQVNYLIAKACERIRVESLRFKNILYDLIERLDSYRRHGAPPSEVVPIRSAMDNEAKKVLASKCPLSAIEALLADSGSSDPKIALQLFVIGLSRITDRPLHGILNTSPIIGRQLLTEFLKVLPKDGAHEFTTISKHALSYPPTPDFWQAKTVVLYNLQSASKQNTLLEYLLQGQSKRLVTQRDERTKNYRSQKRDVTTTINLTSHTDRDDHPAFASADVLCIPIKNGGAIMDRLYENQVKDLAGLTDGNATAYARELLQHIPKQLESLSVCNPVIEQVSLNGFFGNDLKTLGKYLKLVNLITLLHQKKQTVKLTKTKKYIDVRPKYMVQALELFRGLWLKKDDELYFNVRSTFGRLKEHLKKEHPTNYKGVLFKLREVRKPLSMNPVTLQRHLNTLELYGQVERASGNRRTGFKYRVLEWGDYRSKIGAYTKLIEDLKELERPTKLKKQG